MPSKRSARVFHSLLVLTLATTLTTAAAAATDVTVPGNAMPWTYTAKLNDNRQFGTGDGTPPLVATLASLGAAPGQKLLIKYVSGTVCPGGSYPCGDAKGYAGFVTDHNTGNSGKYFPSRYIAKEPTYLVELVGVYTDAKGKIVGRPFIIPDKANQAIPAGATQLQLGVNDDIFSDNSGNWLISIAVD